MTPSSQTPAPTGSADGTRRWRVRRGGTADLTICVELEASSFERPWTRSMLHDELDTPSSLLLIAAPAGGATAAAAEPSAAAESGADGYALFRVQPPEAELLRIAVRPASRRRGVADALLARAIRRLRAAGAESLVLEVRSDNLAALRLYERWGFERVGIRQGYYRGGGDALVLRRPSLDSSAPRA